MRRAGSRILVIDDDASNVALLSRLLRRAGYANVVCATGGSSGLAAYRRLQPDLVILDLRMPGADGFSVLGSMMDQATSSVTVPVLVLTADTSAFARRRSYALGAHDFAVKPYDVADVLRRIEALLEVGAKARASCRHLRELGADWTAAGGGADAERRMLESLAAACAFRDRMSDGHTRRVGELSAALAGELGQPQSFVAALRRCAPLHDLGKVAVPDEILLKPSSLTAEEMALTRRHALIGALMLSGSGLPLMRLASEIALTHHERWDGTGYPRGLQGDAIPLSGRIVAVADVFDALSHERPYKRAWSLEATMAEIAAGRGSRFDPAVVDALVRLVVRTGVAAAA